MQRVGYIREDVCGWSVFFEDVDWSEQKPLLREMIAGRLAELRQALPRSAVDQLMSVPIYADIRTPDFPEVATYHPIGGRPWLVEHGEPVEKEGAVNIVDAHRFIEIVRVFYPACLMHEMAHAYHDQFVPGRHQNGEVAAIFQTAVERETSARLASGTLPATSLPNMLLNPAEYFANLSTAYFARNCESPYDRAELLAIDAGGADLIRRLWRA